MKLRDSPPVSSGPGNDESPTSAVAPPPSDWLAYAVLTCVATALGLYAITLNHLFYATYGPFYDSLSYSLVLARVYARVRENGLLAGLVGTFGMTSTVALPWIEGCFFASALALRRDLFIWIQLPWILLLGLAGYRYFHGRIGHAALPALALCLPLLAIRGVFDFDGGLSDFRMDLVQYLLLTTTFLAYLTIHQAPTPAGLGAWASLGVVAGIACLARATTPVYLALAFGPLFVLDILRAHGRPAPLLSRYGIAAFVLVVVAGWFYATNFRNLHYTISSENTAANENLPLRRSSPICKSFDRTSAGRVVGSRAFHRPSALFLHRRIAGPPLWRDLNWRAL